MDAKWNYDFQVSPAEQSAFRQLRGDSNALHSDPIFAREAKFEGPLVYGALIIAKILGIMDSVFPGSGSIWSRLAIDFREPLYVHQQATLKVETLHGRGPGSVAIVTDNCLRIPNGGCRLDTGHAADGSAMSEPPHCSAIVTGATGGLGRWICLGLAEARWDVCPGWRCSEDRVRPLLADLTQRKVHPLKLDMLDPDSFERALDFEPPSPVEAQILNAAR